MSMNIKKSLERLSLDAGNAVVIGSGILNALGIRESKDIDVVVDRDTYSRLSADAHFRKEQNHDREILADDLFEIGTNWVVLGREWKFADLLDTSVVIDGMRYITLQFLLDTKRSWVQNGTFRPKDKDDIELMEIYQRTHP